jgi:IS605 OrfB family transposase
VYRTIKVKLDLDEDSKARALRTMEMYTEAYKIAAEWGFYNKECNKLKVHHATYYPTREIIPELPSTLVESAKDTACEALKRNDFEKIPRRKAHAAVRLSSKAIKVYLKSGLLNFIASGITRIHSKFKLPDCFLKYQDWKVKAGVLIYSKIRDTFFFGIIVEKQSNVINPPGDVMGIDRGLRNIAVCSNNSFFQSNHIRNIKGKYAHLRAELQSKGTRSAKRRLKQLAGRERRFVNCENHRITKEIVKSNFSVFVLENLCGIQKKPTFTKKMSKNLHSWAFWRFEFYLQYKAEELGKDVIWVNPNLTSQRCSSCGFTSQKNRIRGEFRCQECECELNADLNAARNIAQIGKAELSRLPVREPYVMQSMMDIILQQGNPNDNCSHEPSRIGDGHSEFRKSYGSISFGRPKCFQEYYYGREGLGEEE